MIWFTGEKGERHRRCGIGAAGGAVFDIKTLLNYKLFNRCDLHAIGMAVGHRRVRCFSAEEQTPKMSNVILLAEDSPDDALFFKRALKKAGVINPVHVVRDGYQAIAYLVGEGFYSDRERFPEPSVLFLDLLMPRADGWYVLNWLSTQPQPKKPLVIVMTGAEGFMRLQDAYAMGAQSFIFKPLEVEELHGLIDNWPDRWTLKPVDAKSTGFKDLPDKPVKHKRFNKPKRAKGPAEEEEPD